MPLNEKASLHPKHVKELPASVSPFLSRALSAASGGGPRLFGLCVEIVSLPSALLAAVLLRFLPPLDQKSLLIISGTDFSHISGTNLVPVTSTVFFKKEKTVRESQSHLTACGSWPTTPTPRPNGLTVRGI